MTALIENDSEHQALSTTSPHPTMTVTAGEDLNASAVQVAVRVRPMLPFEAGNTQCIEALPLSAATQTGVRLGGESGPTFTFDQVFPLTTTQHDVYTHRVAPLVSSCLEGYNATILAYGQTGSGKTHTIMGPSASITSAVQDERQAGVIPRAIRSIFEQLETWKEEAEQEEHSNTKYEYDVRVQFLEVYGEEIRDLLTTQQPNSKHKLSIRDVGMDEPEVVGATETKVDAAEEALLCLTRGMYRRVTGATAMNETSSRSHAILSLIIEQSTIVMDPSGAVDGTSRKSDHEEGGDGPAMQSHTQARRSKFNFVDLAGSERQKRTQATGQRLKEGININQGLLVLGNVISALGDPKKQGKTFVPYRDSKLTRLLKGSLGGNHKTLMIACVSPASINMEESLNCLRYANRAKNIQNRAVVNIDATSRLVSELRGKMQLLASDLLQARDGYVDTCKVPLEIVQALAKGGDGGGDAMGAPGQAPFSPVALHLRPQSPYAKENIIPPLISECTPASALQFERVKAENEVYRLKLDTLSQTSNGSSDTSDALQTAFIARAAEYEREIAVLQAQAAGVTPSSYLSIPQPDFEKTSIISEEKPYLPNLPPRTPNRSSPNRHRPPERSESPELSRLRAQMFGSMAQSQNLDAEVEAEEEAVHVLTSRYLGRESEGVDDDEGEGNIPPSEPDDPHHMDIIGEAFAVQLEAEVYELSTSINAKEELIQKLQGSQEKYEAMRAFYEDKLVEMEVLLAEKEHETETLSDELKKLDMNHSGSKELAERLTKKKEQIAELKKKQAELSRLTSVASRNESQISKLRNEVIDMKQKKVDLQKQITSERKCHAMEVQKLKKESMQKDKELNKVKKVKDQKTIEAQRAQHMAKSRLEQVNQLKSKYRESEKRLRMQTVKRGVMSKAGLDPVLVGRRQPKKSAGAKNNQGSTEELNDDTINIDGLRDFFDQKVADVGRREALAEKLAQEWEEHLDLSSQFDELAPTSSEDEEDESLQSLLSQIKYKENRIRQLASRLGKRQRDSDGSEQPQDEDRTLFTKDFISHTGDASPMASAKMGAKVLFGMVVRERRRIAALARTASALDEKVQEAEAAASAKDAAFRAYVDEQRLEAAELAQNQQEHILSLMDMVREEPEDSIAEEDLSSPVRSAKARHAEKANSKLLLLANERITVLERQLQETQLGREAIQKHREREDEARSMVEEKARECEELEDELNDLRSAMRYIREEVTKPSEESGSGPYDEDSPRISKAILEIVVNCLHPSAKPTDSKAKRRRSFASTAAHKSPGPSTEFAHTSDSDEVPDWADDIMQDLAVIAEGKMPTSLMKSQDIADAEAQLGNPSVFDRLTNPESFTGVQKQKNKPTKSTKKTRVPAPAETVLEGQRQRKMISRQVADSLDKVIIPGETPPGDTIRRSSKEKSTAKEDFRKRSVFDRLLSPSNLTGTQKQRFQDKKGKRDHSGGTSLDKALEEYQPESEVKGKGRSISDLANGKEAEDMLGDILDDSESGSADPKTLIHPSAVKSQLLSSSKRDEYKGLDVFERLNKTTTQAYAVKQHVNIAEKMLGDLLDEEYERQQEDEHQKSEPHFERVEAYAQQNVFERLQKTTKRAYAVKQNNSMAERMLDDVLEKREGSLSGMDPLSPSLKHKPKIGEAANMRSNAIATGSFSNVADQVLDDILDEDAQEGDELAPGAFSPISRRLRPRR